MPKTQTLVVHSETAMLRVTIYRLDRIVHESNDVARCSVCCFSLLFLYSLASLIKLVCLGTISVTVPFVASSKGRSLRFLGQTTSNRT